MYVIPLLRRLCAALPDKSNLLTLVAVCALFFCQDYVRERKTSVRELRKEE